MKQATNTISHSYLLIGSGRVARHLSHYFNLLNIQHDSWDRSQDPIAIRHKLNSASHILLAISDSALEGFYRQYLAGYEKTLVHFSGAIQVSGMISAHPLMTFSSDLYDLEIYKKIHLTICGGTLNESLPGLSNPWSEILPEQKALYHTACVLGGNFTSLLIQKMLQIFSDLSIPSTAAEVYLNQILKNNLHSTGHMLTGPLIRKDILTVEKNLESLNNDPYQDIYRSFLTAHWPHYPRK